VRHHDTSPPAWGNYTMSRASKLRTSGHKRLLQKAPSLSSDWVPIKRAGFRVVVQFHFLEWGSFVLGLSFRCACSAFWKSFSSCLNSAVVLGLGTERNCRRKPKVVHMNPKVTQDGFSTFTTAAGLAFSHSGHCAAPISKPRFGLAITSALWSTQSADRPSDVVISLKFDEVA
jgi:hypothetical protein